MQMSRGATTLTANWGLIWIPKVELIIAVSGFPELYDTSLFVYRDNRKKNEAWRKVADIVGL